MEQKTSPPKRLHYAVELHDRAVQLVFEAIAEKGDRAAAISEVSRSLHVKRGTLRNWVRQAEIDRGVRAGLTTQRRALLRVLKSESRELRRASPMPVDILFHLFRSVLVPLALVPLVVLPALDDLGFVISPTAARLPGTAPPLLLIFTAVYYSFAGLALTWAERSHWALDLLLRITSPRHPVDWNEFRSDETRLAHPAESLREMLRGYTVAGRHRYGWGMAALGPWDELWYVGQVLLGIFIGILAPFIVADRLQIIANSAQGPWASIASVASVALANLVVLGAAVFYYGVFLRWLVAVGIRLGHPRRVVAWTCGVQAVLLSFVDFLLALRHS